MTPTPSTLRVQLAFAGALALFFTLFFLLGLFGEGWQKEWGAGLVLIGFYVVFARPWRARNPEVQDSIYFLGFLMTLTYLVIGLLRADGVTSEWIESFISELGIALGFSIFGLGVRQVVTLGAGGDSTSSPSIPPVEVSEASARRLAEVLSEALRPVTARFEESARAGVEVLNEGHRKLQESLERLQEGAAEAAGSLTAASRGIADSAKEANAEAKKAIAQANQAISRQIEASARVSGVLGKHIDDLEATVGALAREMDTVGGQVAGATEKVSQTSHRMSARLEESEKMISASVNLVATTWRDQLELVRRDLTDVNVLWKQELASGLDDLRVLTNELRALAEAVRTSVAAIPSPADRVEQVWTALAEGEQKISGASKQMAESLVKLRGDVEKLGEHVEKSGRALESGSEHVRQALAAEAKEIQRLIDELYRVLESQILAVGRR